MPGGHHPRRTIEHRTEIVPSAQLGFAGRQPHPHRQLQRPLRGHRRIHRRSWRRERGAHAVTGVLEQPAAVPLDRRAQHLVVGGQRLPHPSASASHRRVEPSTSVNRNVTTPEGAGTSAECHNEPCSTLNITGRPRQQIMGFPAQLFQRCDMGFSVAINALYRPKTPTLTRSHREGRSGGREPPGQRLLRLRTAANSPSGKAANRTIPDAVILCLGSRMAGAPRRWPRLSRRSRSEPIM